MSVTGVTSRPKGFSLVELLVVIAIIAILASLLLPAINQGRARAKLIGCSSDLREVGLAFQNFAHDHNGQFPMSVPASAGGSAEYTAASYQVAGEFYFSFRHFQALSNELVTPKILACPSDTRQAAASFISFDNKNLSYLIGLKADYSRPYSILAGDRNLTNDYPNIPSLIKPQVNGGWRWTTELHRSKGNFLFSDGHVEEKTSKSLSASLEQPPFASDLALPDVPRSGRPVIAGSQYVAPISPARNPANQPTYPAPVASVPQPNSFRSINSSPVPSTISSAPAGAVATSTNPSSESKPAPLPAGPAPKPGVPEDPGFSLIPMPAAAFHHPLGPGWLLFLLLLFLLLIAAAVVRARLQSAKQDSHTGDGD